MCQRSARNAGACNDIQGSNGRGALLLWKLFGVRRLLRSWELHGFAKRVDEGAGGVGDRSPKVISQVLELLRKTETHCLRERRREARHQGPQRVLRGKGYLLALPPQLLEDAVVARPQQRGKTRSSLCCEAWAATNCCSCCPSGSSSARRPAAPGSRALARTALTALLRPTSAKAFRAAPRRRRDVASYPQQRPTHMKLAV